MLRFRERILPGERADAAEDPHLPDGKAKVLEESGLSADPNCPRYDTEVLFYAGWIYRYWHYKTGESSREIYLQADADQILGSYGLHVESNDLAVEDLKTAAKNRKNKGVQSMKHMTYLLLLLVIAAGCDRLGGSSQDEQLELERQRQETVRREREDRERFAKALTEYANGKQKLVKETIGRLEGDARALKDDIEKLSKIIASGGEEKDSAGKELPIETKLLRILRSPEVNDLAKKYLSTDFVFLQHEFVDLIRDARADESRYRKVLSQSEESYAKSLEEAQKWVNATKEQRAAEIDRVQEEINSWENRRRSYLKSFQELSKKTLAGNLSKERERREKMDVLDRKIRDADDEIRRKRYQVDFLQNPTANNGMESLAAQRKQNVQGRANQQRERELNTIDRYYRPKSTVAAVVAETSEKTIEKLQGVMAERHQAAEKELAAAKRKEVEIRECILAIPVSNMTELKALRSKMEK